MLTASTRTDNSGTLDIRTKSEKIYHDESHIFIYNFIFQPICVNDIYIPTLQKRGSSMITGSRDNSQRPIGALKSSGRCFATSAAIQRALSAMYPHPHETTFSSPKNVKEAACRRLLSSGTRECSDATARYFLTPPELLQKGCLPTVHACVRACRRAFSQQTTAKVRDISLRTQKESCGTASRGSRDDRGDERRWQAGVARWCGLWFVGKGTPTLERNGGRPRDSRAEPNVSPHCRAHCRL